MDVLPSFWQLLQGTALLSLTWLAYQVVFGIYNVYFHPLARFPGPKWAGATGWWKTYVEVYHGRTSIDRLFELHKQYGTVVRVAPNELHFSEPSAYHDIYNSRAKWDKDPVVYRLFGQDASTFTTVDYRSAKKRKDLVAPHFSRKSVLSMQGLIREGLEELCGIIQERVEDGKPVDIFRAFRCLSLDNITSYCFGHSVHALQAPDFKAGMTEELHEGLLAYQFMKHFPAVQWFIRVLSHFLLSVAKLLPVKPHSYMEWYLMNKAQVDTFTANPSALKDAPHRLIYHTLLDPASPLKLTQASLCDEAGLFLVAGTDTVSNASTIGVMYTLYSDILPRLREELLQVWPRLDEPPSLEVLEGLQILRAVCKEALRLSHGVLSPMMRIVPPEGATIAGHTVPGGTSVGISNVFVHLNPTLFPDPRAFRPERWLEPGAEHLDAWLVAFSKGPRSCLGINLAWCELYMNIAHIIRRFDAAPTGMWALMMSKSPLMLQECFLRDCYLPYFGGTDLEVYLQAAK